MFVFLLVIGATVITLQLTVHRVWESTLREQIKLNLKQKTLMAFACRYRFAGGSGCGGSRHGHRSYRQGAGRFRS
jgi:hypothetical protein